MSNNERGKKWIAREGETETETELGRQKGETKIDKRTAGLLVAVAVWPALFALPPAWPPVATETI